MFTVRVDVSRLRAKIKRAISATPRARQEALRIMVSRVMQRRNAAAHRDTNADSNAWNGAANAAGLGPLDILPLNARSKKLKRGNYLLEGVRYWRLIVTNNAALNRVGKWPTDAQARLAAAEARLAEFYAVNPGLVREGITLGPPYSNRLGIVRHGGAGVEVQVGDVTFFRLHNKEPHASFVEGRFHTMQFARGVFRQFGLRGMGGKKFADRIAVASGLASPRRGARL